MYLVERLFGLAPDGGSGALEAAVFCGVLLVVLVAARVRARVR